MVNKELANLKNRFTEDKLSLNVAEPKYFFFIIINFFITFNQIYKTYSKRKQKKHKTICTLDTRLYLVIYFSLTLKICKISQIKETEAAIQEVLCKKAAPKNLAKLTGINTFARAYPSTKLQARNQQLY